MQTFKIFCRLVETLEADNGCQFKVCPRDFKAAYRSIELLHKNGFFKDSPDDLDGSFWQMAAGETSEAWFYFDKNQRCQDAYRKVSGVLNKIFERS